MQNPENAKKRSPISQKDRTPLRRILKLYDVLQHEKSCSIWTYGFQGKAINLSLF